MVEFATQVKRRRGTTAENDAFTGAEGEITIDLEKHELRLHDGQTQGGFVIGAGGSGSGRNIGDIFYTKRTDTGLAGAVECNGGTYNTEDYEGEGSIGELLEGGLLDYVSLTDYATAISTKGWCDKIGWNGAGTTSFRVPTLTPHIIQKNNIPVIGNGMALGLTNGNQNGVLTSFDNHYENIVGSGYGQPVGTGVSTNYLQTYVAYGVTTDGTKSGIIADTTDTAQLRVMIQLAIGATDEALEVCTQVLADVAGLKTDTSGIIDYVVEKQDPTAENGYTWYRKYKSGWVEQGGVSGGLNTVVTLPVEMANTNYALVCSGVYASRTNAQASSWSGVSGDRTSTTTITLGNSAGFVTMGWQVSGISA